MKNIDGKKIIFDGDSLLESRADDFRGWPYRTGEALGLEVYNYSVGGGTVTAEMYVAGCGTPRHWVSRSIDKIKAEHENCDYIIFDGGSNDADLLGIGSDRFGSFDENDFSGNYDDTTFTGAMETLFYKAITYYPTAKIGFIILQKMGRPTDEDGKYFMRAHYFNRAAQICKKWGVPYLDLWNESPLNPSLTCYWDESLDRDGNTAAGKAYFDGQHLTTRGYELTANRVISFISSL